MSYNSSHHLRSALACPAVVEGSAQVGPYVVEVVRGHATAVALVHLDMRLVTVGHEARVDKGVTEVPVVAHSHRIWSQRSCLLQPLEGPGDNGRWIQAAPGVGVLSSVAVGAADMPWEVAM